MFKPEKFKNKKALILGAGKSGIYCANLLISKGFKVLVTEQKKSRKKTGILKQLRAQTEIETGGHSENIFKCGFAVKSPGISNLSPVIRQIKKKGIPIFSEIEIAISFIKKAKMFAVTGTNGKTTTAILLSEILKQSLKKSKNKSWLCGNMGIPVSQIADKVKPGDHLAMEVSSYQLEDSSYIKPLVSSITNITPDHISHHGGFKKYLKAKTKIFEFQNKKNFCVMNCADKKKFEKAPKSTPIKLFFSLSEKRGISAYLKDNSINVNFRNKKIKFNPPKLSGLHNIENSMTAALMALAGGVKPKDIQDAFDKFKGIEHRIETVRTLSGIKFINDSKATNISSVIAALKALSSANKNILLILGGKDKGASYKPLAPLIKKHVKCVLTIGEAARKIERELKGTTQIISAGKLDNAVKAAFKKAEKSDIALLSPACASFDQFKSFEDRGKQFKKLIKKLR